MGIRPDGDGVTAEFEDGTIARGDLLVGADGIFSTVRQTLFPGWEPKYAAHAMRPNLGQGACTAVEDAVVLAQSLAGSTDVPQALRRYQRRRRRRVWWIHRMSDITSRLQLLDGAAVCRLRDAYLWLQPGPLLAQTFMRPILTFRAAQRTV